MTAGVSDAIEVIRLGLTDYRAAWVMQRTLQAEVIAAKRAGRPADISQKLIIVEHPPVFTLGRGGDRANLLVSEEDLARRGASFVPVDRGGDITFHGPGQIVAYPIFDLDRLTTRAGESLHDLHRYLRTLEEIVIDTCAAFGIRAGREEGRTGVWVGPDARGDERKICAMGVRCSRWVTMHGLALNVHTDLSWYDSIVPCGIDDRGVTSISAETGVPIGLADVETELRRAFESNLAAPFVESERIM